MDKMGITLEGFLLREVEFKAWNKFYKKFVDGDIARDYILGEIIDDPNHDVVQYTGRKDKNGQKIFEGDVLKLPDRLVVVIYNEFGARFDCCFLRYIDKPDMMFKGCPAEHWGNYEVIGNTYENPELREG